MIVLQDYGNPSKSEGNHESGSVAGFASPAVITAGSMFLISKGMIRTRVVGFISLENYYSIF
jgi:hypothetical protein